MRSKENSPRLEVKIFPNPQDYDKFLDNQGMGSGYGARAKGKQRINGSYYLSGGIEKSQIAAIVEHERIELTSGSPNPHEDSAIGEYRYIKENYGPEGLRQYHSNLCNLMGGLNDARIRALNEVLGRG